MRPKNRTKRSAVLGALAIAIMLLLCAPATAGPRHAKSRGHAEHRARVHQHRQHPARHGRARVVHGRHAARRPPASVRGAFVVPGHIGHGHAGEYRAYYRGKRYYGPHRHYHVIYSFPVHTPSGYVWRPHSYCNGRLHTAYVAYRGPHFSVGVSF